MPRKTTNKAHGAELERSQEAALDAEETPRTRPMWSGTLSFGLVTIPVDLYPATRATRTSLRMLAPTGTPVARRYFTADGKAVNPEELERGYELEDGTFVPVSDEELEGLAPEQSRDIDLTRFVERAEIPPLLFERPYILAPAGNSNVAYRLLASILERTGKAGIASFVMRGKQYVVAILAEDGLLRAETLRFEDELRSPETVGLPKPKSPNRQQVTALRKAIARASAATPNKRELVDSYWQRLEALVEKKRKKGEDVVKPAPGEHQQEQLAEVIDLVSILRQSLAQPGGAAPAVPAAGARGARSRASSRTPAAPKHPATKKAAKRPAKRAAKAAKRGR